MSAKQKAARVIRDHVNTARKCACGIRPMDEYAWSENVIDQITRAGVTLTESRR